MFLNSISYTDLMYLLCQIVVTAIFHPRVWHHRLWEWRLGWGGVSGRLSGELRAGHPGGKALVCFVEVRFGMAGRKFNTGRVKTMHWYMD